MLRTVYLHAQAVEDKIVQSGVSAGETQNGLSDRPKPCCREACLPVPVAITMQEQIRVFDRCCTRSGQAELKIPVPYEIAAFFKGLQG